MKVFRMLFMLAALIFVTSWNAESVLAWCNPGDIYCGTILDSNNAQGHTDVNRYNCTGTTNYNGKAHVYLLDHPGDSLWLRLDWTLEENNKLHIFVLGSCNRNDCIAHADSVLNLDLPPDEYWIIVDGRANNTNEYTLRVYCGDHPLSAELMSFTGSAVENGIRLDWNTASETNNDRFEIERSAGMQNDFEVIAAVDGQGTTAEATHYSYTDRSVSNGMYTYRLIAVDLAGIRQDLGMINVEATPHVSEMITDFRLIANYPNPFNPSTMIHFELAQAGDISLDVFDVQGRLVENLVSGMRDAGSYQVGFNAVGFSSGVYFARLSGATRTEMMKMVLMK